MRAISFDGDATLWDFETARHAGLLAALERLAARVPNHGLTASDLQAARDAVRAEAPEAAPSHEALRLAGFERALHSLDCDAASLATDMFAVFMERRFAAIELYSDSRPCLDALRPRKLALISNGNTYPERIGLEGLLDAVIFAHDVGAPKPDARPFRAACERLGCAPSQILHVGDSLDDDVRGARDAGLCPVWLNRSGAPTPRDVEHQIGSLTELPDLVAHLEGDRR